MNINNREIGSPCFIVAEIGQNHNGDVDTAELLIEMAMRCNVDAVKFQARDITQDMTAAELDQPYNSDHSYGLTYREHREALELTEEEHLRLKEYAEDLDLVWFCTACDTKSVEMLERIGNPIYKVASRDLDNGPLLEAIAATGKPVILSTGMADLDDIRLALHTLDANDRTAVLHCLSQYPADPQKVNLRCIQAMKDALGLPIGLSDHTSGPLTAVAGAAIGACIVEKHVTLGRAGKGTDHAGSLEEAGLRTLVERIRVVESAMGDGVKRRSHASSEARKKLGRSLVAVETIPQDTLVTADMVALKSPGWGISWPDRRKVIGRRAVKDIPADTTIMHNACVKTVAVIAARMDSTRFPGKVLAPLYGRPLLEWAVGAMMSDNLVDDIIVATTTLPADVPIVQWCLDDDIKCHRGDPDDVLGRVYDAAKSVDADFVVRGLADCPLMRPEYMDELIRDIRSGGADYVAHKYPDGSPTVHCGLFPEVMSIGCLERAKDELLEDRHREHVTIGMYENPDRFSCRWLAAPIPAADPFVVDTPEDLAAMERYLQND